MTLSAIAIAAFAAVLGLTTRFHHWQASLAEHMYQQGERALQSGRAAAAIEDFRSALAFDRDNFWYQFSLAQSLEAEGRFDEAESYLVNLWERQPQNGMVNLQLARLAAHRQLTSQALRYYHNAIYGIWDRDPDQNRRTARFELIQFLLKQNARTQAQSELIAMEAGLPPDPQLHLKVADLFLQIQDYENALGQFRQVLQLDRKNVQAAAGAGEAAFDLGRYRTALRYLEPAVAANHKDEESARMLETAGLIIENNPFRRKLSLAERKHRVHTAFQAASLRLNACMQAHGESTSSAGAESSFQKLYAQEMHLKPKVRSRALDDPDFQENVMDFVFDTEEETKECGSPSALDEALLLIGRNREGAEQ
ncbi:MAG TPA: tetratricopeptide repeat protein [Terriglobales bacterium]|nr:tetratricopeptide repeat protein [Terriglobales bacterium]